MPGANVDILNDVWDQDNHSLNMDLAVRLDSTNDSITAVGDVAADGQDAGNPVKIGGKASTSVPTAISQSLDRVDAYFDANGRLAVFPGATWTTTHFPAEGSTAVASRDAAGGTIRNVCQAIYVSIVGNTTAPTAQSASWVLRDGATAAGTVKYGGRIGIAAVAGFHQNIIITGLWIEGSANNAMTLEFGAGAANTRQTASIQGTTIGL